MLSLRSTVTSASSGRFFPSPSPHFSPSPFPLPFPPTLSTDRDPDRAAAGAPPRRCRRSPSSPEPRSLPSPEPRSPSSLGRRGLPHRRRRWIRLPRPPRAPSADARSRLPWAAARSPAAAALDPALPGRCLLARRRIRLPRLCGGPPTGRRCRGPAASVGR